MTRVSVGIPVYNGEKYLAETLDSLLAQTMTDLEIVISDNASTDRTRRSRDLSSKGPPRSLFSQRPEHRSCGELQPDV